MPDLILCKCCSKKITSYSDTLLHLWIILCINFLENEGIFETFDTLGLYILEKEGFVVTHESEKEDFVKVRVNGYNFNEDVGHIFCLETWLHSII